jgi:long-chain acyl-CoA synthetase
VSLNLAVMLRESARAHPEKAAVVSDDVRLTYDHLDALSNQVASGLRADGLEPGDRVALMLPNVPQFVIAYYGVLKAGGIVVPLNVQLKAQEIAYFLGDSGARCLVAWDDVADEASRGAAAAGGAETYVVQRRGGAPPPEGTHPFTDLLRGSPRFDPAGTSPEDTAVILYTSGTTGLARGAELTHLNLFMCCQVSASRLVEIRPDDVSLAVLPLSHAFGQSSVMNTTIYAGGTMSLVPRFDPGHVVEVIRRDQVSIFCGVPAMFFALLHLPESSRAGLWSLRLCISGGASLPGEVMREFEERFGVTILEGYGLSETSPTASFNLSREQRRPLSIGRPVWGVEMRVVGPDGRELPRGPDGVGEIVIRGHNVMKGYFRRPEATAEAMRGGWFHSGDLGYADEDGFFFLVDRLKDVVIRGGYTVYPREVEEVLHAHPAVAAAAVIGVPDERLGEEVQAVVQLKPGRQVSPDDLMAYCGERLASYKHPRSIVFVDQLPLGPTGQVLKRELKAEAAKPG